MVTRLGGRLALGILLVALSSGCAADPSSVAAPPTVPAPGRTLEPCVAPTQAADTADLVEMATVVVVGSVTAPPEVLADLGTQHIIGYRLSETQVISGPPDSKVDLAVFNAASSEPLSNGRYVLFLTRDQPGRAGEFSVAYGIRGAFSVDTSGAVHPICPDPDHPGRPVVGSSETTVDSLVALLSSKSSSPTTSRTG